MAVAPRMVIEFPQRLLPETIDYIAQQLENIPPGRTIVLTDGARVRSVSADGLVTPADPPPVVPPPAVNVRVDLSWAAFAIGAVAGSLLTLLATVVR